MGKVKLDFNYDYDFFLLSIHSTLEDYRLALFLNVLFNIQLRKSEACLNFKHQNGTFSIFDCDNAKNYTYWSLISNKLVIEEQMESNTFSLFDTIYKTYILIKEKKEVDYFLKIEGDLTPSQKLQIKDAITKIKGVLACAELAPKKLKTINNLIY